VDNAVNNPLELLLGIGTGFQSGPTGVSSPDGLVPIFGEMFEGLLTAHDRIPLGTNDADVAPLYTAKPHLLALEGATDRHGVERVALGDLGVIPTDSNLPPTLLKGNLPADQTITQEPIDAVQATQTTGTAIPEMSKPVSVDLSSTISRPIIFPTAVAVHDVLTQQDIDRFTAGLVKEEGVDPLVADRGSIDPIATTETGHAIITREPVELANGLYEVKQARVHGNQMHLELAAPDVDSPTIELRIDLESLKNLSTESGRTQPSAFPRDDAMAGLLRTSSGGAVAPARTETPARAVAPLTQLEPSSDLWPAKNPDDVLSGFEDLLKKVRVTQIEIRRGAATLTNSKDHAGTETHLTIVAQQSGREMLIRAKLDPDSMTAIVRKEVLPGTNLSSDQHQIDILAIDDEKLSRVFVAQRSVQRTELSGVPLGDRNMIAASQYQVTIPQGMGQVRRLSSDLGTIDQSWQQDDTIPGQDSERVATALQAKHGRIVDSFRVAMTGNSTVLRAATETVDGGVKTIVEQNTLGAQAIDDPLKTDIGMSRPRMESTSSVRVHLPENTQLKLNAGEQVITLRIEPEHLGPAKLTLRMHNDRLRARVMVNSIEAKAALENSLENLTQQLSRANIKVDQIDVQLSNQQQQNPFGGRHNWQSWSSLRNPATDPLETATPYIEPLQAMQQVGVGGVNILA